MVKKCAFPGCTIREKPISKRKTSSMCQNERINFFNFPLNDVERLKLWLLAVQRDVNLPLKVVKRMRLCSEHFTPDDFKPVDKNGRRLLKSTAVPNLVIQNYKDTEEPSQRSQDPVSPDPVRTSFLPQTDLSENTVTDEIFSASYLNTVPQSTPVKQHSIRSSMQEPDNTLPSSLLLVLSSPATAVKCSKPSTSGTYYAFPAAKSKLFCEKTDADNENLSEDLSLDVSMLSLNPPSEKNDTSFVPPSSTSTSTPTTEDDEENRLKDRKWIVNESSLMELFNRCHYCGASIIDTQKTTCGSLIRVKWECCNGHHGKWDSCDDIRGMPANNLLVAACTLFTGATYVDIDDWATLLNLQLPKKTTFYAIQSSYLIPVIDVMYKEQQENILEGLRMQNILQKGVHLAGDGRNDSPGFSAKYCTYSLMDDSTNQVVHYELVQVTEASSSVGMEPVGFKRGLNSLLEKGIDIEVMTTDRSPSIRKIMRVDYPQIHHEFDIWHVVKGFFKKLLSVSKKKENIDLQPWIKSICNHLWYACASCSGDPDVLTESWKSLLHHICGEHQWEENGRQQRCAHDDLTPDQQKRKRWLRKDSPAFKTLSSLVLQQNLLKDMRQMAFFKHTGGLEVYHSVLLKYCRKNLHFHYSSMTARTQLAIMDHNENVNRQQATTRSGVPRYNVVFPKQNKEWVARKIYEPTTQKFRDELLQKALDRRNDPNVLFKDPTSQVSFPVLPCNIATKNKPEKEAVIAKHASRFSN